ncbi:MAG: type II secretion system protein GspE [Planctomycetaceae bacterium]|nr:type II secretion system protein GspE [Planctomycetaceae bacterium]
MVQSVEKHSPSESSSRAKLGEILVDQGRLTRIDLDDSLSDQQQSGDRLGQILLRKGRIGHADLVQALAQQASVPTVDLEHQHVAGTALSCVPPELAIKHKVLPFSMDNGSLSVAMSDPFDRAALDAVRTLSGRRVRRFHVPEPILLDAIQQHYGSNVARMIAEFDEPTEAPTTVEEEQQLTHQLEEMAREPTVVNLVDLIIHEAAADRASDIHIEPFDQVLKVKYRIDGVLHEMSPPPKRLHSAIISRVKILAHMDIAERFIPQDGHITFEAQRGKIDIRVATVPTVFGESVVMRLLDRASALIALDDLGLNDECLQQFDSLLRHSHGIVLVTGPTGSGKTTTLYAVLSRIFTTAKKIITIEDPVEYQLEGVNQIPVNPKRGLDFARGLRSILRQDPDIIMVGEIRDGETADIAIRSALTGHLVFSTLHTNDAAGAVTRLIDMGIEPFLLASSLEGVLAQRLIRAICPDCKRPASPDAEMLLRLGHRYEQGVQYFEGAGCAKCRSTGFYERTGIFELLRVTEDVRQAILQGGTTAAISRAAPPDHQSMADDGYQKVVSGLTTIDEVFRVTQNTLEEVV